MDAPLFGCGSCTAVTDGNANLTVVAHSLGCAVLIAQTRLRWPLRPARLPPTQRQVPLARWGDSRPFRFK